MATTTSDVLPTYNWRYLKNQDMWVKVCDGAFNEANNLEMGYDLLPIIGSCVSCGQQVTVSPEGFAIIHVVHAAVMRGLRLAANDDVFPPTRVPCRTTLATGD